MSFTKTSEGRVFFKNADNDDAPYINKPTAASKKSGEPMLPADNTQIQILLLLKSLNSKLKISKDDQGAMKKQLAQYKATIKNLEEKTSTQEANYIDLEQKVSNKQNEANKKSSRIENSVKSTLKQLEEAKNLVKELESKDNERSETLEELKETIAKQNKKDDIIIKRQKSLAITQKEQGEKMVNNVAAYVALTKRVSEAETRNEALDNKIENTSSEYLKLDRKIDKAIEDRNRILRKVDRIEQAVLETRDALNAKAMVLLTDQGAVAGINIPQISDEALQTDPIALSRRLQEEALMPWWRKPVRIQGTSLALILVIAMLIGFIVNGANTPSSSVITASAPPIISLHTPQNSQQTDYYTNNSGVINDYSYSDKIEPTPAPLIERSADNNYGITIHEGINDPSQINKDIALLDINNETEMLAAFESDPERVAHRLNQIEPSSLTSQDKIEPTPVPLKEINKPIAKSPIKVQTQNNGSYTASLKKRITPDPNLKDIAKKIENQAFEGIPEAQHDMGAIYVAGHGQIEKNLPRAALWFQEAAQNGISNAKYNLGVLYHQGLGVEQNVEHAMVLYNEAAKLGHPEAQYNLGIANIEGIGVAYNPKRAAHFFEMAANEGVTEAAYNLGLIYENGLLGETHPNDALSWYKKAADQGSPEAKSALEQLASSLGISVDDVNRIVDNLPKTQNNYSGGSASSNIQSYITAQIQKELMSRGLYPGPIDGMSGPMTQDAIKQFQEEAKLNINGQASQELLDYMKDTY